MPNTVKIEAPKTKEGEYIEVQKHKYKQELRPILGTTSLRLCWRMTLLVKNG